MDRLAKVLAHYGDGEFAVGILAFGTCFFPRPGETFALEAARLLGGLSGGAADFVVKEMDDTNFVVRFSEHVFGVVLRDEFESNRGRIAIEASSSDSPEHFVSKPNVPEDHVLIGLYARTRLFADIADPKVAKIVQAER